MLIWVDVWEEEGDWYRVGVKKQQKDQEEGEGGITIPEIISSWIIQGSNAIRVMRKLESPIQLVLGSINTSKHEPVFTGWK